jgi:hypothetical protein
MTKLPEPEQWVLQKMTFEEVSEMIERHIDFVDKDGRSVRPRASIVKHYMRRSDGALPTLVAVAQLPIVLLDGEMLAPDGLDRLRGIIFIIPKELREVLPKHEDCTKEAVEKAMKFLTDEWLGDVATDYAGKCILIACALTIIERSLLPSRPAFFVTAGRRGSGKTTTLTMLIMAVTGISPASSAWTENEDERRKALLSYFMMGLPYILWDNIRRGSQIACPHVERSCTSGYYMDRKLGVSEAVATAAATIHLFTGNNIAPKGDLASRSLTVRLEVDRPDPENRKFRHPDPIGWTDENRAEILKALYTLLLGNPTLDEPREAEMKTRYREWYRAVGSAVENAAKTVGKTVDFTKLFLAQDEEDDEDTSLAAALAAMGAKWGDKHFVAKDAESVVNNAFEDEHGRTIREFLYPTLEQGAKVSARSVGKALKWHVDNPVRSGSQTFVLRRVMGTREALHYKVEVKDD